MEARPARVLVVDDDADIRRLVANVLRLGGFEPEMSASGVEALEHLGSVAAAAGDLPDLVLLDVQMPELDGWDTLRQLRGDSRLAGLRVVLCTVKAGPVNVALGVSLGCDGYVSKPFSIDELLDTVRRITGACSNSSNIRHRVLGKGVGGGGGRSVGS